MKIFDNPPICIVIGTYFRAESLVKVLDSILALNYPKELIEVVIVVDPHDEEALNVIKRFMSNGSNVRFRTVTLDINSANRGRNLGIMECDSEVVAVVDDDVVLHPETVNVALRHLRDEKVAAVGFPAISVSRPLGERLHHRRFLGLKAVEVFTVMPLTFFRRSVLLKVGLYREDMGPPLTIHEDWELGSRIRRYGYKVIASGELRMLHLVEQPPSKGEGTALAQHKRSTLVHKLGDVIRSVVRYARAYVDKHWWSFFQVLRVSPLSQKLEYVSYYLIPPAAVLLLVLDVFWFLAFLLATLTLVEVYSFVRGYYRVLSIWERLAYPPILVLARVTRSYLALAGLLYNTIRKGIGRLG